MKSIRFLAIFLTLAMLVPAAVWAGDDEEAIRQAVLNYANSLYLVQPELVGESVHPKLQKVGYAMRGDDEVYREYWMTYEELEDLAGRWNKEGRVDPETARHEVTILDRLDQTAVARLNAEWGIDFFHLVKLEGEWKIINVIWQTYPPEAGEDP